MRAMTTLSLLFVALLFAACTKISIDPVRVANNRAVIEKCADPYVCIGGFVEWTDGSIFLITDRCEDACDSHNIEASWLENKIDDDEFLNRIRVIVLPHRPDWRETGNKFLQQFVRVEFFEGVESAI